MVMVIDWVIMVFMTLSTKIVSVFKGWTTRLRTTSSKCHLVLERHLE